MSTAKSKLGWRADLLWSKLGGRAPNVPWGLLWDWIGQRHAPDEDAVITGALDADAGMVQLTVRGFSFWFPSDANPAQLGVGYREVFDADHPHHYEGGGAHIRPGDVVLDAGACEGYFVRYALDRGARVIAVEPWSRLAACLERTFAKEVAEGRLKVLCALLGSEAGSLDLRINFEHPFSSNTDDLPDRLNNVVEEARVVRIDDVVRSSGWNQLDFIKMDIEGAERLALAGAADSIARYLPRVGITTYHRADDWKVLAAQVGTPATPYQFSYKGVIFYPGGYRPMMMHGWPVASPIRPAVSTQAEAPIPG